MPGTLWAWREQGQNVLIGILGGGQLGRMLALAGYPLGLRFRVLDPQPAAPASYLADHVPGDYDDPKVLQRFAAGLQLVTYEFENVPFDSARELNSYVPVYPPPGALAVAQDRLAEKRFFEELEIPVPAFAGVDTRADLDAAVQRIGLPAVLKTRRMGYDGRGQLLLRTADDLEPAWERLGGYPLILEAFVPFERELSILALRGRDGAMACYPLVENRHEHGILRLSIAPAAGIDATLQQLAESYAERILQVLDYVGLLAIELFLVPGSPAQLLANEMAPRVHNSGHWTIEGAQTSQFANHLRAIVGLPLGSTAARGCSVMVNLIGSLPDSAAVLRIPETQLHLYGKAPRPGRKLGHITCVVQQREQLRERLAQLEAVLGIPLLPHNSR